ncbi:MAG: hypothetical protein LLG97_19970 [Deltaproteobacteria bacterium]|nr:hypothetical protein [Deltaproteobacteria bacterium]
MKRLLCLPIMLLVFAACGSTPAPVWIAAGHKQIESFKEDFLTGRSPAITETHFRNALDEIKKGGDLDLLGKAWLTRMALQTAVLAEMDPGEYPRIEAAQSVPANDNYYRFLKGDSSVNAALLPEHYRPFWMGLRSSDAAKASAAIAAIDDPLSRLIAAGLAVRQRLESEAICRTAVETAAEKGWKRALLSWLKRLKSLHDSVGEAAKAAAIQSRIDLMK